MEWIADSGKPGNGDKGAPLSTIVFQQHCRRKYTLLFRAGTVLLFVMYSWRWDIHHSCSVGQTWLSNSSGVKSSRSTVPFFASYQNTENQKTGAYSIPWGVLVRGGWGDIGIFNNMLWKKKFLHPSILFGTAPTLSKILHSTILCIQKPTQKHLCVTHTKKFRRVHTNSVFLCVCTHTHTQPRALIFL